MADSNSAIGMAQPIQSSVQGWVDGQEQKGFAYREEQRKIKELERLAKEKADAKQKGLEDQYLKRPKTEATGLKSIDDAINSWADENMNQRYEIFKRSDKFNNLSGSDRRLLASLDAMPETIALMTKAYKEDSARYFEGVKSGKIKRDPDYELKLQKLPTSATAFLDADGNPAIGMDNDGDGKPDIISFDMNGLSLKPNFVENVDLEGEIKSVAANLETEILKTDKNFRERTTEGLPLGIAKSTARRMVTNPDGSLTPLAISYFHDQGLRNADELDDAKIVAFENYLTDRLVNSKKRRDETDVDYTNQRLSAEAAKAGKKDKEFYITDLTNASNTITNGATVANNFTGNVEILRKVGSQNEKFQSFNRDRNGNLTVMVEVAQPKWTEAQIKGQTANIADEEERAAKAAELAAETGSITTKKYSSNDNANEVLYYVQRFKNPDTDKYYKTVDEFRKDLPAFNPNNTKGSDSGIGSKYN